jgi:hypothetical protein
MKRLIASLCSLLFGTIGCSSQPSSPSQTQRPQVQRGGVYATKSEDGQFSISKVLECDDFAVHLRFYNEKFASIPTTIDTTKLTFFIGHAPLAVEGFLKESPTLISVEPVQEEELDGYRLYLEAMDEK